MKFLVADDSKHIRDRLIRLLSRLDGIASIDQAGSGMETIEKADKIKPDVIILDLQMPNGNGFTVLKESKVARKAVIVIMTNYPSKEFRSESIKLGAHYFFDKTQEFDLAIETIRGLLESRNGN